MTRSWHIPGTEVKPTWLQPMVRGRAQTVGLVGLLKLFISLLRAKVGHFRQGMMNRLPLLDVPPCLHTYPIVYPSEAALSWQISRRSVSILLCFVLSPKASIAEQGL